MSGQRVAIAQPPKHANAPEIKADGPTGQLQLRCAGMAHLPADNPILLPTDTTAKSKQLVPSSSLMPQLQDRSIVRFVSAASRFRSGGTYLHPAQDIPYIVHSSHALQEPDLVRRANNELIGLPGGFSHTQNTQSPASPDGVLISVDATSLVK